MTPGLSVIRKYPACLKRFIALSRNGLLGKLATFSMANRKGFFAHGQRNVKRFKNFGIVRWSKRTDRRRHPSQERSNRLGPEHILLRLLETDRMAKVWPTVSTNVKKAQQIQQVRIAHHDAICL
jgi:hypothetical protein